MSDAGSIIMARVRKSLWKLDEHLSERQCRDYALAVMDGLRSPPREACQVALDATNAVSGEEGYADALDVIELQFNAIVDEAMK
jgi:hypothetical protein